MKVFEYKDENKHIKKHNIMNFSLTVHLAKVCVGGWRLHTYHKGLTQEGHLVIYLIYEREIILE